ncbi:pyridoxamine 5'-phosphate oxidase family protein [Sulfitobacter mediterraneus]|uniref:pyridoxamine 5'-phosphate oxidase family protein n=1 Tax=Sulfitobacter mediterraneus TaxID=83219 RepID=UPI0019323F2D|nr:pyridoxamine 5'-phosphate oxidase family protein [Sulfitobacter mediterraneus]MBM1311423.1 pyridoxamine 5'-phosphate oxidase family protein [Sulfitobacter mediterraneus]MBM1315305.1 pyridoxamine 5'-phosphate oxidase family protein [Sulfitobacter mediterraneus]MBM1323666.1 pyridoxamine 5'-phosphate oxidase family protein [Sulfitobacter mediterraneus]MBM1327578.1 pyridoxamine 5'-phosphate oxidase family protein [Sulfitobacter mediterraneus]MBM1398926.1 pyridoxamine 5'-phosphate oxidase family
MYKITDIAALEALYGQAGAPSLRKVADRLTPLYRKWIMASKLCVLSTVGAEGTDASPRGDDGPVVTELDEFTLAMPDWRGNNRLDSLRNIVTDGRVSLMFVVPGSNNVVRVNGTAFLTDDADLRARFEKKGRQPATVIVIQIAEIYTQCARALMRAGTWAGVDESTGLPTVGEILAEMTSGEEGGAPYDAAWGARAKDTMW